MIESGSWIETLTRKRELNFSEQKLKKEKKFSGKETENTGTISCLNSIECYYNWINLIFGRHKGKKLVSEIKSDAKEECKGGVECSDEDPNDDEMSEKEYVQSKQPGSNFLQLLSDELSNDPTDTSDADGDILDLLMLC